MTKNVNQQHYNNKLGFVQLDARYTFITGFKNKQTGEIVNFDGVDFKLVAFITQRQAYFSNVKRSSYFESLDRICTAVTGSGYRSNGNNRARVKKLLQIGLLDVATTSKGSIKNKGKKSVNALDDVLHSYDLVNDALMMFDTPEETAQRKADKAQRLDKTKTTKTTPTFNQILSDIFECEYIDIDAIESVVDVVPVESVVECEPLKVVVPEEKETPTLESVTPTLQAPSNIDLQPLQLEAMRLCREIDPLLKMDYKKRLHRLIEDDKLYDNTRDGGGILFNAMNNSLLSFSYDYNVTFVAAVVAVNHELGCIVNNASFYEKAITFMQDNKQKVDDITTVSSDNVDDSIFDEYDDLDDLDGLPF